jgi:hypothetical protein
LTLDPDIADGVSREVRRTGLTMKEVVNQALRTGLGIGGKPPRPRPFRVEPHSFGFRPGIDLDRLNQLVDELEVSELARKSER